MSAQRRRGAAIETVKVGDHVFIVLDILTPWGERDVAAYGGTVVAVDGAALRIAVDLSVVGVRVVQERGERVVPWRNVARMGVKSPKPGDVSPEIAP